MEIVVVLRALVLIIGEHHDRGAGRVSLEDAAQDVDSVLLFTRGRDVALTRLAAVELLLNISL